MEPRIEAALGVEARAAVDRGPFHEGRPALRHGLRAEAPDPRRPELARLRADATADDIVANHLHIDTGYIERDLSVALPLARAREQVAEGRLGSLAETHYSTMGYQGSDTSELEQKSAPEIADRMLSEEVDIALLAPV